MHADHVVHHSGVRRYEPLGALGFALGLVLRLPGAETLLLGIQSSLECALDCCDWLAVVANRRSQQCCLQGYRSWAPARGVNSRLGDDTRGDIAELVPDLGRLRRIIAD